MNEKHKQYFNVRNDKTLIERRIPTQNELLVFEELKQIKLISEGMENLFKKHINEKTYEDFVNKTNSKRYTSSRIQRAMLYVLLQIKKEENI